MQRPNLPVLIVLTLLGVVAFSEYYSSTMVYEYVKVKDSMMPWLADLVVVEESAYAKTGNYASEPANILARLPRWFALRRIETILIGGKKSWRVSLTRNPSSFGICPLFFGCYKITYTAAPQEFQCSQPHLARGIIVGLREELNDLIELRRPISAARRILPGRRE